MNRYDIGRRIEAYRDQMHMSTQELAERIKRSQATISRIENGKQGLTFELLSAIAAELRIHPFALLSDEPLRASILLPAPGKRDDEYTPALLANTLQGGRIKRRLGIDAAAKLLDVSACELESIELTLTSPEDSLLLRMCELYGLPGDQALALKRFNEAAPDIARGLAYLQRLFSYCSQLVHRAEEGEERRVVSHIAELLDSAESDCPLPLDSGSDDIGLFLNRLSLHLVNALKDKNFRNRMSELASLGGTGGDAAPVLDN